MRAPFAILSVLLLLLLPTPASGGVQEELDVLPLEGGLVKLPCGTFSEDGAILHMPSNATLRGNGPCTIVPPIDAKDNWTRQFSLTIENLKIDGDLADNYIGVDFRNVSLSLVRDVRIRNVLTGVLVYRDAFYNILDRVDIEADVDCLEVLEIGNETKWKGGRCLSANTGVWVRGSNNVTIEDVAIELVGTCVLLGPGAVSTTLEDLRCESASVWLDESPSASGTVQSGNYLSGVSP